MTFRIITRGQRRADIARRSGIAHPPPPEAFEHWHIVAVIATGEPDTYDVHWFHHEDCPSAIGWLPHTVDHRGDTLDPGGHYTDWHCWAANEYRESGSWEWAKSYSDQLPEPGFYAVRPWAEVITGMEGTEWDGGWEIVPLHDWLNTDAAIAATEGRQG